MKRITKRSLYMSTFMSISTLTYLAENMLNAKVARKQIHGGLREERSIWLNSFIPVRKVYARDI